MFPVLQIMIVILYKEQLVTQMGVVNVIFNTFLCLQKITVHLMVVMCRSVQILVFVKRFMMMETRDATVDNAIVKQDFDIIKILRHVNITTKNQNPLDQNALNHQSVGAVFLAPRSVFVNAISVMLRIIITPVIK